jgi:hypothetical protein
MSGFNAVATAIIAGQQKVMGPVAINLARSVSGITVGDDGSATVSGGIDAVDALVKTYSGLTGQLGVRMCHQAAQQALQQHPDVQVPSFQGL